MTKKQTKNKPTQTLNKCQVLNRGEVCEDPSSRRNAGQEVGRKFQRGFMCQRNPEVDVTGETELDLLSPIYTFAAPTVHSVTSAECVFLLAVLQILEITGQTWSAPQK